VMKRLGMTRRGEADWPAGYHQVWYALDREPPQGG
jgi:hypothetical protein